MMKPVIQGWSRKKETKGGTNDIKYARLEDQHDTLHLVANTSWQN